ncbi:MAG: MFS transporter [Bacillota bacterium]
MNIAQVELWDRHRREIKAWRIMIWLVLSLAYLIAYFHRVSPAVIVNELFSLYHVEAASVVGGLASVYFYVYFMMQVPAGVLADLLGPRRVVAMGIAAAALGSVWFGLAWSVSGLFASRFLIGLGVSVVYVSALKAYSAWFGPQELGTAVGLTSFIGNLGGVLAATPLSVLVSSLGLSAAFITVGLISAAVAAMTWLVVRNDPWDIFPAGQGITRPAGRQAASWSRLAQNLFKILRNRHTWLALIGPFCIYGPFMAMIGVWGVSFLTQVYGLERHAAATYTVLFSVGVMLGTLTVGFLSDRLGSRKKPYLAYAVGNLLVWACLFFWNNGLPPFKALPALYFLLGFFGNVGILSSVIVKEYNPPEVAGLAAGIGNIGGFAGSAFMQPFFGYLLDRHWDGVVVGGVKLYSPGAFHYAFGACLLFSCLAVVAISLMRESLREK